MKTKNLLMALAVMAVIYGCQPAQSNETKKAEPEKEAFDFEKEKAAILEVIEQESKAFWDKDFNKWASYWAQEDYVRTMGWWARGGITVVEGWEQRGPRTKQHMEEFPEPNEQNVTRKNWNIRISENMAWATFYQYGTDTGEPVMDMPGLSHETRIFEKVNGQWKIVYVGWLLQGE